LTGPPLLDELELLELLLDELELLELLLPLEELELPELLELLLEDVAPPLELDDAPELDVLPEPPELLELLDVPELDTPLELDVLMPEELFVDPELELLVWPVPPLDDVPTPTPQPDNVAMTTVAKAIRAVKCGRRRLFTVDCGIRCLATGAKLRKSGCMHRSRASKTRSCTEDNGR